MKVEVLFDRLSRLHALAAWAGDEFAAWALEDLLVFLPSLVAVEPEGEPRNPLDEFWSRLEDGAYEALVQPETFWERVEIQVRDAHVREQRAKRLADSAGRRFLNVRAVGELFAEGLLQSDREVRAFEELASRSTEESRGWTESDMHALLHFQPQNVPPGLRADQFAVVTASVLGRKEHGRPAAPERDAWARLRELAREVRGGSLRWTCSGADSPAIRLCGYSLTGTIGIDARAVAERRVPSLEREGETILLVQTEALVVRLHVFAEGGIVRGSAMARTLGDPDTAAATLERTLTQDVNRLLRAGRG